MCGCLVCLDGTCKCGCHNSHILTLTNVFPPPLLKQHKGALYYYPTQYLCFKYIVHLVEKCLHVARLKEDLLYICEFENMGVIYIDISRPESCSMQAFFN